MPHLSTRITTHSLLPAHPLLFLALPVSFHLHHLLTLVSISSDQVVIAAHPMHLGSTVAYHGVAVGFALGSECPIRALPDMPDATGQ